ncbi:hypothetical protein [Bacillus wiedmannii]|uniref:hypothetical protein n=1 Tax=Bacillus wiedmannii TaxID=1890302 RepID=UPI001243D687|nr:hypothetical protein [Bacillus wiedmannii]
MKKRSRIYLAKKVEDKKYKGLKEGQARVIGCTRISHAYPLGEIVNVVDIEGNSVKCTPTHSRFYDGYCQWISKTDLVIR